MTVKIILTYLCFFNLFHSVALGAANPEISEIIQIAYRNEKQGFYTVSKKQYQKALKLDPANIYALEAMKRFKVIEKIVSDCNWHDQRIESRKSILSILDQRKLIVEKEILELTAQHAKLIEEARYARTNACLSTLGQNKYIWRRLADNLESKAATTNSKLFDSNKRLMDINSSIYKNKIGIKNSRKEIDSSRTNIPKALPPHVYMGYPQKHTNLNCPTVNSPIPVKLIDGVYRNY